MSPPDPTPRRLSALLVHRGEGARIVAAVESLQRDWGRTRMGLDLEVAVFDDATPGASGELAQLERRGARVLRSPVPRGLAAGYQAALGATSGDAGDVVMLLDPRAVVLPGALEPLMAAASDPDCGLCGPRLVLDVAAGLERAAPPPASPLRLALRRLGRFRAGGPDRRALLAWTESAATPVDVLPPGCLLLRRQVLRSAGLLDPEAPAGWEAADLAVRVAGSGFDVVQHSGVAVALPWRPDEADLARARDEADLEWARLVGGFGAAVLVAGARALELPPALLAARARRFTDLGATDDPPRVELGRECCFALEVAPVADFSVSAGLVDEGAAWTLPPEAWETLPRGSYCARATDLETRKPLGRWTWRKTSPGRAEARSPEEIAGDLEAAWPDVDDVAAALPGAPAPQESGDPHVAAILSSILGSGGPTIPGS